MTPTCQLLLPEIEELIRSGQYSDLREALHHLHPADVAYRTVSIDGVNIFYREAGPPDAPAILLLHGFPSSSHMFRNLIPQLADRYRVIAPDYPGFGYSDQPPRESFAYTFDNLARVIDGFTRALPKAEASSTSSLMVSTDLASSQAMTLRPSTQRRTVRNRPAGER